MMRLAAAMVLAVACTAPPAQAQRDGAPHWAGTWLLERDDARIRTRAGAETLRIDLRPGAAGQVTLRWTAGRGICEDPLGPPCEWVGARGSTTAVVAGPRVLVALLRVSADADDPFLLVLERGEAGRAAGQLVSEKGGIAYRLDAGRE